MLQSHKVFPSPFETNRGFLLLYSTEGHEDGEFNFTALLKKRWVKIHELKELKWPASAEELWKHKI